MYSPSIASLIDTLRAFSSRRRRGVWKSFMCHEQASQWRDGAKEIIKATASKKTMVDILHHPQHIDPVHWYHIIQKQDG